VAVVDPMTIESKPTLLDVARIVGTRVAAHGFSRRGLTLLKRASESTALIGFQSSTGSSSQRLKFTVNVGIKFDCLLYEREKRSTSISESHLRWRLGQLLTQPDDTWWETTPGGNMLSLGNDIALLIEEAALPINRYVDPLAVIALWESGQAAGLTEFQRVGSWNVGRAEWPNRLMSPSSPARFMRFC
jgi:hypothetical protein